MQRKLLPVPYPVIVEGKYDKIRLSNVIDAHVITTGGFSLFRDKKKIEYLKKMCDSLGGVIVFTDSDGAGLVIRSYLRTVLGANRKVYHLYTPRIEGKEKRKIEPSKEGVLGVEGIDCGSLRLIFSTFLQHIGTDSEVTADCRTVMTHRIITKAQFYSDGLSGGAGSRARRERLCQLLGIPENISSGALLEAVNLLGAGDIYDEFVRSDFAENEQSAP